MDELYALVKGRALPIVPQEEMTSIVEMLLINGPTVDIFMSMADVGIANREDVWSFVTGENLVAAYAMFVEGETLTAPRFAFPFQFEGMKLTDLPYWIQRRLHRRDVSVQYIEPGTPPDVVQSMRDSIRLMTGP
jgi:hypothetical protein